MRERPQPQLLLAGRPQPRQAVRLDDQEEDDQRAEDHELEVRGGRVTEIGMPSQRGTLAQQERQQRR